MKYNLNDFFKNDIAISQINQNLGKLALAIRVLQRFDEEPSEVSEKDIIDYMKFVIEYNKNLNKNLEKEVDTIIANTPSKYINDLIEILDTYITICTEKGVFEMIETMQDLMTEDFMAIVQKEYY